MLVTDRVTLDLSSLFPYIKRCGDKAYEIYIITNYNYPFTGSSIHAAKREIAKSIGCKVDDIYNHIDKQAFNISVIFMHNAIEQKINMLCKRYIEIKFEKIEVLDIPNGKFEVTFSYTSK